MKFKSLLVFLFYAKYTFSATIKEIKDITIATNSSDDGSGSFFLSTEYAPVDVSCPISINSRAAYSISNSESEYLLNRRAKTNEALLDFFKSTKLANNDSRIDFEKLIASHNITIGLAFSGGGYRAMLSGAGQVAALDSRTSNGESKSPLSGVLQSSSYISGLSGGAWLVGSLAVNNFKNVYELFGSENVYNFQNTVVTPYGLNISKNIDFWSTIKKEVSSKLLGGFPISIVDILGRALSHQIFEVYEGGVNFTFSDVQNVEAFKSFNMPFPILIAQEGSQINYTDSTFTTIIEMNPFDFGSWDSSLNAFYDIKYLGSNFDESNSRCINGFDNMGFLVGSSSALLGKLVEDIESMSNNSIIFYDEAAGAEFDMNIFDNNFDARISPNPFNGVNIESVGILSKESELVLVDGGSDGQIIPFAPLIQKERKVDIIFAFDNSADTDDYWPNGSSIYSTFLRQSKGIVNKSKFPEIPTVEEFLSQGLTKKPVFFGCDSNSTNGYPLIIYIPNSYYTGKGNVSTVKFTFTDEEVDTIVKNGYAGATRINSSEDEEWSSCVACAFLKKTFKTNETIPSICERCFTDYCWFR